MDLTLIFVTVAAAHFLALLSPGPDFVLLVKSSLKNRRRDALGVAVGIASANAIYIALCLAGVGTILAASLPLMFAVKIIGALFLIYLAFLALKAKKTDYAGLQEQIAGSMSQTNFLKEFLVGLMSGLLNPKNLLFYLSLFTVVLTNDVGVSFKMALCVWMTLVVLLWDSAIVVVLSGTSARHTFSKLAYYLDKLTGAVLGFIGISILRSAFLKQ